MLCVVAACEPQRFVCSRDSTVQVSVSVRDSITGAPAASNSALVAMSPIRTYYDSLGSGPAADSAGLVIDARPGTYDLTVRKVGYISYRNPSYDVPVAPCDLSEAALLSVKLVPSR